MLNERLQTLSAIDPARLTEIVRRSQDSANFEIEAWSVRQLSDLGGVNPEGLFLFEGQGRDAHGQRPWSLVLKTIRATRPELDPSHVWHWKREYSAMQSGLLERMPGPLVAPRCYGLEEQPDGAWIWMEHIADQSPRRWGVDEFAFAAGQLGLTTGAWLASRSAPDEPWLCRAHALPWAETFPPSDEVWANPYVQSTWSNVLRERTLAIWAERARLSKALANLPQTFAHFDSQRRNLMIRPGAGGQAELVAVDWAWCGLGPVGADAAILLGNSLLLVEADAQSAPALDQAIFPSYLAGLRSAGWTGEADVARAAYSASIALFCCSAALSFTLYSTHPDNHVLTQRQFGLDAAGCAQHFAHLAAFALDHGEQALRLLDQMGL